MCVEPRDTLTWWTGSKIEWFVIATCWIAYTNANVVSLQCCDSPVTDHIQQTDTRCNQTVSTFICCALLHGCRRRRFFEMIYHAAFIHRIPVQRPAGDFVVLQSLLRPTQFVQRRNCYEFWFNFGQVRRTLRLLQHNSRKSVCVCVCVCNSELDMLPLCRSLSLRCAWINSSKICFDATE